jgi:hypothetical protein
MKCLLFAFATLACSVLAQDPSRGCPWSVVRATGESIGGDQHAAYYGLRIVPSPDDRLEVDAAFPHARYFSWTVYNHDGKLVASMNDRQIRPVHGKNPFHPGVLRHKPDIGRYRLTFQFKQRATEGVNTVHVPGGGDGRRFMIYYRLYDVDRPYSPGPLAASGGVPAPILRVYDAAGKSYCPDTLVPDEQPKASERRYPAQNPPFWWNTGSTTAETGWYSNEGVVYVAGYFSGRYGPLCVLRWRPPQTPVEAHEGRPFPLREEARFWSLDFSGENRIGVADREVPQLADGSRQLVVGFNGVEKPSFVPVDQWVGMKGEDVSVLFRIMLAADDYHHNLAKLPAGPVPPEHMAIVPGGVYCTQEQLKKNPNIGLRREESK